MDFKGGLHGVGTLGGARRLLGQQLGSWQREALDPQRQGQGEGPGLADEATERPSKAPLGGADWQQGQGYTGVTPHHARHPQSFSSRARSPGLGHKTPKPSQEAPLVASGSLAGAAFRGSVSSSIK